MKIIYSVFAVLFGLSLTACGSSTSFNNIDTVPEQIITEDQEVHQLILNDSLNQEGTIFLRGESITFVLSLTNNSNEVIFLEFNSGQQYDFYVTDADTDEEVWRWSSNQLFTQATTSEEITKGNSLTYQEQWDQKLLDGTTLPTGNYVAHGFILGELETTKAFTIQ